MKSLKFLSFVFLLLNSIAGAAQSGFIIEGEISGASGIKSLYFTQGAFHSVSSPKVTRVQVLNGKFSMKGTLTEPAPGYISLTADYKKDPAQSKQFILDKGRIRIQINGKLADAMVSGSKAQDDLQRFNASHVPYFNKLKELNEASAMLSQAGVSADSISSRFYVPLRDAGRAAAASQRDFVKNNPSAFMSLLLIPEIVKVSNDYFESDSLFKLLDAEITAGATAKTIRGYIETGKKVSVGASAPDFALSDTSGKKVHLSSLKGKYVLLDFWAAWCKPCRRENPNILKAYTIFKDKGFTVFGVSLDRERKNWVKAILQDNLSWQQVSDLKYWSSEAALLYGVRRIPGNFLLDPEGKIIARNLMGPDLVEKLNEVLAEKKTN